MRLGLLEILLIVAAIFLCVGARQLPKIAVAIKESRNILKDSSEDDASEIASKNENTGE